MRKKHDTVYITDEQLYQAHVRCRDTYVECEKTDHPEYRKICDWLEQHDNGNE